MIAGVCEPEAIGRAVCVMTLVTSGSSKKLLYHASRARSSRTDTAVGIVAGR